MSDLVERFETDPDICNQCGQLQYHCGCRDKSDSAADTIARLESELAEARDNALDEAAEALDQRVGDEWQRAAQAIRALKSPKPPIL